MKEFGLRLQASVASNLNCFEQGGDLLPGDIDISFKEKGEFDIQNKDLVVTITANWFSDREKDAEKRLKDIAADIQRSEILSVDVTVGLWLLLPKAAWIDYTA